METIWRRNDEGERNMDCQDFEELFGAYALGALSDDERKVADAHLAECPKCTRTLQQLQTIVELFPLSVPAMDPPPRLKAQIIAHIQAKEAEQQFSPQRSITSARRQKSWRRWSTSLLAATTLLLLVLVAGMLFWNLTLRQQVTQITPTQVASPVTYTIHGTGSTGAATGQVIYYPQQDLTVLVVHGLPQLTGTHVYQGWLLQGGSTQSIGLLNVQNGVGTLDFQGNLLGYDTAAISLEKGPLASPNAPKGPVVALGSLKAQ